ncbi:hypothetical protein C8Q70DRAFT_279482 [Cubamyces menziesii]|nr:hypothetical protein C8Q70DRAFT_279482 [Cubamyces menziesii]
MNSAYSIQSLCDLPRSFGDVSRRLSASANAEQHRMFSTSCDWRVSSLVPFAPPPACARRRLRRSPEMSALRDRSKFYKYERRGFPVPPLSRSHVVMLGCVLFAFATCRGPSTQPSTAESVCFLRSQTTPRGSRWTPAFARLHVLSPSTTCSRVYGLVRVAHANKFAADNVCQINGTCLCSFATYCIVRSCGAHRVFHPGTLEMTRKRASECSAHQVQSSSSSRRSRLNERRDRDDARE